MLRIVAEEAVHDALGLAALPEIARKHELEVVFYNLTDLVAETDAALLGRLRRGEIREEELYPGVEANPLCTGCYVTRIRLKQWNRLLEETISAAEKFSALAPLSPYPRLKFRNLYRSLSLLQFHDALTGSHGDGAYEELIALCRETARIARLQYREAAESCVAGVTASAGSGEFAAAVFNPLPWDISGEPVEITLDLPDGPETCVAANGPDAAPLGVLPLSATKLSCGRKISLRLTGLSIPQHGYSIIRYRPVENTAPPKLGGNLMENEFYRVDFDKNGNAEIFDKELGETVLNSGAGAPWYEDDYGNPWDTFVPPLYMNRASLATHSSPTIAIHQNEVCSTAAISGVFNSARFQGRRGIKKIEWSQEITLYHGVKGVYFRTTVDWDSPNGRIFLRHPLPFRTPEDEALYEIPFGVIARKCYNGVFGQHSKPNGDWPALNFISCQHPEKKFHVTITNRGLPCHRVQEGVVKLSVLRSPTLPWSAHDIEGALDTGRHIFETAVFSGAGGITEHNPVRLGMAFNAEFIAVPLPVSPHGSGPLTRSFLKHVNPAVAVCAVKGAENGEGLIVRGYEPYGHPAMEHFPEHGAVRETDLLERNDRPASMNLKPHEIKTWRIGRKM